MPLTEPTYFQNIIKSLILILTSLYVISACNTTKLTHEQVVTNYYEAFDTGDFEKLEGMISDSLTIVAGDFIMSFDHDSYHEQFKWDSIFRPSYELIKMESLGDQIIATVSLSSLHHKFLKNDPMTCGYRISFIGDKISKLVELDCPDADWGLWVSERDSLVNWIREHHPELDGFINDLTMRGSLNYLRAIELYQKKTD